VVVDWLVPAAVASGWVDAAACVVESSGWLSACKHCKYSAKYLISVMFVMMSVHCPSLQFSHQQLLSSSIVTSTAQLLGQIYLERP
jgi:hypothetical protein